PHSAIKTPYFTAQQSFAHFVTITVYKMKSGGDMFELLAIIVLIFAAIIFFKLLVLVFEAGIFLLAIPFKILGILLAVIGSVILLPLVVIPVLLSALFPLIVVGLAGLGLYYLLK
ncbi:MAG: hypothetical protein KDE62_10625, partial [Calditrichaeota bacterium]|nr:hypothetical protein [Calditrichota bacterium]